MQLSFPESSLAIILSSNAVHLNTLAWLQAASASQDFYM